MKKFITDFVPEYERILSMRNESKNRINGHFYFKNGFLVMLIGFGSMYLIGFMMNLLTSISFIYYATNVVVLVSLFLFYYAKEVFVRGGQKEQYNVWIGTLYDYFIVVDVILFGLMVLMYSFLREYFNTAELMVVTVGYVLYFVVSIILKKQVANVLYALIIAFGLMALLLLFQGAGVYIQYPLSVILITIFSTCKNKVDFLFYSIRHSIMIVVVLVLVLLFSSLVRESGKHDWDLNAKPGFEFHKIGLEDKNIRNAYVDEKYVYYHYTDLTSSYVVIMDFEFNEVKRLDMLEDESMSNYIIANNGFYTWKNNGDGEQEYYRLSDNLEFDERVDVSVVHAMPSLVGYTVIEEDNGYVYADNQDQPTMLKKVGDSYEVMFTLDKDIHEYYIYRMHQFDDYFLFYGTINDLKKLYLYDMNGNIIASYTDDNLYKRGMETQINNGNSASTGNYVYDVFYNDVDDAYYMIMKDGLYKIDKLYINNYSFTTGTEDYILTGLWMLIGYLLLPIKFRKVGE